MADLAQTQAAPKAASSELWNSLTDYLDSVPLPTALTPYRDAITDYKNARLPEKPLSDQQSGALYGLRSAQKDLAKGAHRVSGTSVSLPSIPGGRAVADRFKLAGTAVSSSRGGRLVSGLLKGTTRLGGRLLAPALFALDVFSEEDRSRGVAKASGGLAASSIAFMVGSSIGAGIGTVFLPGVGTSIGYYAGGLIGAAIAYGWGRKGGTAAYDWTNREHPEVIAKGKQLARAGISKAKELSSSTIAGVKKHAPSLFPRAKSFIGNLFSGKDGE